MASAPSLGHCNTMGTALTMNAVAEGLGMSLPGCAAIPAPYRERGQMAYRTGQRIVEMIGEDLRPSCIVTAAAIRNAIALISALGGSTNAQPHLAAIARHAGLELPQDLWMEAGYHVPLLANVQPAGAYLGESFHRAGGVPAIMAALLSGGFLDGTTLTVAGPLSETLRDARPPDGEVIRPLSHPLAERAGFLVLSGNLFDFAIMKTSVISPEFRARYLERPGAPGVVELKAVVFDGADDYHHRINDPGLPVDEDTILVIRGAGPVGWPGSAEVVNMQPPDRLIAAGVRSLPTLGDGRQSGTSDSPSILNASPESAVGGGLSLVRTGDRIRLDLGAGRCDLLVPEAELARRRAEPPPSIPDNRTPWQAIYRRTVGQLSDGAVIEEAVRFRGVARTPPRHNH
jgi:dihydroxy-acid dehydratase